MNSRKRSTHNELQLRRSWSAVVEAFVCRMWDNQSIMKKAPSYLGGGFFSMSIQTDASFADISLLSPKRWRRSFFMAHRKQMR